ncbi:MAG: tetratricopeptide repeat protein [Fidelibacterota bacterium]
MNFITRSTAILCMVLLTFSIGFANGVLQDAQAKYDAGEYKEAMEIIKPFVEDNPELPQALIMAGKIYFKLGYIQEAKEFVDKSIELDRGNQEYRDVRNEMASFATQVTEAIRAKRDGKYAEAEEAFAELLQVNPNFAEGHFQYAQVLLSLEKAKEGAEELQKAMELRPEEEKYSQAAQMYVQKYLSEGNQLLQRRAYDRAEKKFKQALILDADQYMAHYLLARSYYAQRNYQKALEAVDNCIDIHEEYIKAYTVKGNIYVKMNKMQDALATFREITEINPKYTSAWDKIGYIHYRMKNYDEAIPAYNEVIKLRPDYETPYENLGVIYSENKDWDKAIINLKKAAELSPEKETVWYRLAAAYNAAEQARKAKKAAIQALELKSNWAAALYELGIAERRLGDKDAAKNAFRMAARDPKWKKSAEYELKSVQ